jgi:hypothetical protein
MSETTFHKVTITIKAPTPELAYAILCDALDSINGHDETSCEWETDKYSAEGDDHVAEGRRFPNTYSTKRLWNREAD